jgi:hypothetical protein
MAAEDIVNGWTPPRVGARELYEIGRVPGWFSDPDVWSDLDCAVTLAESGTVGTVDEVERDIIDQARRMLQSHAIAEVP